MKFVSQINNKCKFIIDTTLLIPFLYYFQMLRSKYYIKGKIVKKKNKKKNPTTLPLYGQTTYVQSQKGVFKGETAGDGLMQRTLSNLHAGFSRLPRSNDQLQFAFQFQA